MKRRPIVALVGLVGCYAPEPQPGAPCAGTSCPAPLVCSLATLTCEREAVDPDPPDASIDGCVPGIEVCGDGVDQDCDSVDPACADNDRADGAIDITAGGRFTGDLRLARDDVGANGCGGDGGRDLFYSVRLSAPEIYYFDSLRSQFDSVIRVYARPCADVDAGAGALACSDDACGGGLSQVAVALPAGDSCIVVDQGSGDERGGELELEVVRGRRDGFPLRAGNAEATGDTCDAANTSEPRDQDCDAPGNGGKDEAYFFTTCPGETLTLDAETCNDTTEFDSVLYVQRIGGGQLACNDDDCNGLDSRFTNARISGGLLYLLIIDGFDSDFCGPYLLETNLRP